MLKLYVRNLLGWLYDGIFIFVSKNKNSEGVNHSPLQLESYVGNNQIIHPKVLYVDKKFGEHLYWMTYTPFPWGIDKYENPCIAYSDDGYNWENIRNNPIDNPDGNGYDSDPHLIYRETDNVMECWYRYVSKYKYPPVKEILFRRLSKDGINWTPPEMICENYSGDYAHMMSPAILYQDNEYHIWSVSKENGSHIDYSVYSEKGWRKVREIRMEYSIDGESINYRPWHIDVINDKGIYILLVMCKEDVDSHIKSWKLFLSTSIDNVNYERPRPILPGGKNEWDQFSYRSSIVRVGNEYRVYYSAANRMGKYGIGIASSFDLYEFKKMVL